MSMRAARSLAWVLVLAACAGGREAPGPASQPKAVPASAAPPAVGPLCERGSAGYVAAQRALEALDKTVDALAPNADPSDANAQLEQLIAMPCMQLAAGLMSEHAADSALSFKVFWEAGGESALGSALDVLQHRHLTFAPVMRETLALETRRDDPLAPDLLCSLGDPSCGSETRGWRMRAERALEERGAEIDFQRENPEGRALREQCATATLAEPDSTRFGAWRACIEKVITRSDALPVGATRAPASGWFLVRGRRGHYGFCDEIRAYDVESGAAYVVASCSELALGHGGMVDQRATDAARQQKVERGFVLRDNLREAVWMALLSDWVQPDAQTRSVTVKMPDSMTIAVGPPAFTGRELHSQYSTDQTTLAWSFVRAGRELASGTLRWPTDYDRPAHAHAVELLAIAEDSFVPGCPASIPPLSPLFGTQSPGVSFIDSDAKALSELNEQLSATFEAEAKRPCKGGTGR